MRDLILLLLASLWVYETVRVLCETFVPQIWGRLFLLHSFVGAIFPVVVSWPHWVTGLGIAGGVGILHRLLVPEAPTPVAIPRRNRGGLPPLP